MRLPDCLADPVREHPGARHAEAGGTIGSTGSDVLGYAIRFAEQLPAVGIESLSSPLRAAFAVPDRLLFMRGTTLMAVIVFAAEATGPLFRVSAAG